MRSRPLVSLTSLPAQAIAAAVVAAGALAITTVGVADWLLDRGDGAAIVVFVEDGDTGRSPADSILIVRWGRSCDAVTVTTVPRDLVLTADGRPLAVVHAQDGVAASSKAIAHRFDVNVAAVVTLSLDDVSALSRRIGPVTLNLPVPSRDLRSGFHGGPGPVELVGDRLVSFLRSRHWETFDGSDWSLIDATDAGRIDRLHMYLEAAMGRIRGSGLGSMALLLMSAAVRGDIDLHDAPGTAGLVAGTASTTHMLIDVVPTRAEREVDDRRSPLESDHLGALYRARVAPGFSRLADGC